MTYRTANLKSCILYIYSTNIGTEYFKHGIYSPFFPLQNAVCLIVLTYLVPVLFTFYIQGVLKLKNNSGAKRFSISVSYSEVQLNTLTAVCSQYRVHTVIVCHMFSLMWAIFREKRSYTRHVTRIHIKCSSCTHKIKYVFIILG